MRLSPPSFIIFLLSFILVVLVILAKYTTVTIPVLSDIVSKSNFEVLLVAYVLLFLGVIVRGL